MLDLKERTNLTNLTNLFPADSTVKPSLLYIQPASKGETFKYASIYRYLKNIGKVRSAAKVYRWNTLCL